MEAASEWVVRPRLLEALRDDEWVKAALADDVGRWPSFRSRAANPVGANISHTAGTLAAIGEGATAHVCGVDVQLTRPRIRAANRPANH